MFGLLNSDNMKQPVYEEFDRLERAISNFLLTQHGEDGTHNMEPDGLGFVPIGAIVLWPIAAAPSGWHVCDGADISRSVYYQLFGVIGTAYGVGDGSTTYTLPLLAGVGSTSYIIFTGLGV
jgi:hypothetical protein